MVLMTFVLMSETDVGALMFSGSGCVSWIKLSSTRGRGGGGFKCVCALWLWLQCLLLHGCRLR